jgi:1,4-dihydroxy-2-naphthoate octaprenyltransferase
VRLGDARTRQLYQLLVGVALVLPLVLMFATPWCAVGLLAVVPAVRGLRPVRDGSTGAQLIPVLRDTGLTMLVWAIAVSLALFLG